MLTYVADVSFDVTLAILLEHVFELVELYMLGNVSNE
jgi:hypothetical protein